MLTFIHSYILCTLHYLQIYAQYCLSILFILFIVDIVVIVDIIIDRLVYFIIVNVLSPWGIEWVSSWLDSILKLSPLPTLLHPLYWFVCTPYRWWWFLCIFDSRCRWFIDSRCRWFIDTVIVLFVNVLYVLFIAISVLFIAISIIAAMIM